MLTLDIVAENPDKFRVIALAAASNVTLLADQVKTFKPQLVVVRNESLVDELKEALGNLEEKPEIVPGEQRIIEVARHPDTASVVTGIVGCAGLKHQVRGIVYYDILGFSYSQKERFFDTLLVAAQSMSVMVFSIDENTNKGTDAAQVDEAMALATKFAQMKL